MANPMNRDAMRGMKAKKDEELRTQKINTCVMRIYNEAIRYAETNSGTFYSLDIDRQQVSKRLLQPGCTIVGTEYQFYKDNMEEILSGLQDLFPGCTVKLAKMCTGNDGKRYDISKMDDKMLPFINQQNAFECIVVDWS